MFSKDTLLDMIHDLIGELDDAIDFMSTFEDMPESFGDEGLERLNRKSEVLNEICRRLQLKRWG